MTFQGRTPGPFRPASTPRSSMCSVPPAAPEDVTSARPAATPHPQPEERRSPGAPVDCRSAPATPGPPEPSAPVAPAVPRPTCLRVCTTTAVVVAAAGTAAAAAPAGP